MKDKIQILISFLVLLFMASCTIPEPETQAENESVDTLTDLQHLQERGTLRALVSDSNQFFLFRGRPGGFIFDVMNELCEEFDMELDLTVNDSIEECMRLLDEGRVDIIAIDTNRFPFDSSHFCLALATPSRVNPPMGWVIPNTRNDSTVCDTLSSWLKSYRRGLYNTYFLYYVKDTVNPIINDPLHISCFDELIKQTAKDIGWDWRLIASIIYQESRFKEDLESSQGAYGLMQLMPIVMEQYDIDYESPADEQLVAGGKLLRTYEKALTPYVTDSIERKKFIVAAYNAGLGKVFTAIQKAKDNDKDPEIWYDNVDCFINKSQTYRFVIDVMDRYENYKKLID